jgi:tagaturonate epimerase
MSSVTFDKEELNKWISKAESEKLFTDTEFNTKVAAKVTDILFPNSIQQLDKEVVLMAKLPSQNVIAVFGAKNHGFKGETMTYGRQKITFAALTEENAKNLRKVFAFTNPSPIAKTGISVGLGDRLGLASPGHIQLFKKYQAYPVLAQQSVRELNLTERNYESVFDAACWAVFQEGYKQPWGADGDHLKEADWVKKALKIGFTMITADVSDFIRKEFGTADEKTVMAEYEKLDKKYRAEIEKKYLGLSVKLDCGTTISFTKEELARIVLIYKDATDHALTLYKAGKSVKKDYNFELSVDETETPTTYQAHFFAAKESIDKGVVISSLAPRFVGEFQKAIDYIGNPAEFEETFKVHASIARYFGYRVSVHSGSDKFTVFPVIGKLTNGNYHLKTAGTNWLQSLLVISEKNPEFFRTIYKTALEALPAARKYYHITPNLSNVPASDKLPSDADLPKLLQNNDIRQVLHITYGEMFKNKEFKKELYQILNDNIEAYWASVSNHIGKHLDLLGVKKK